MNNHYFVVKWNPADGWSIDNDTADVALPDGTIYNDKTETWTFANPDLDIETHDDDMAVYSALNHLLMMASYPLGDKRDPTK